MFSILIYFRPNISYHLCSLIVGDGSDDFPFVISFSSKALLSVLLHANESLLPVVFHMDSTFKCNENEFPVTLLGISDANRQFHLLSISVVSHRTRDVYIRLITSLHGHIELWIKNYFNLQRQIFSKNPEVRSASLA